MKLGFKFGTKHIEFTVKFSNRKNLAIEVETNGEVNVVAPIGVSEEEIIKRVKSKATWIVQKQYEVRNINVNKINREAVNGESYLYLGRNYTLQLMRKEYINKIEVKLFRGKFIVTTPTKDEEKIKVALEEWYREKALQKINDRIKYYKPFFNKEPKVIKVKEQKKRWASCTSKNELLFNWRCAMAPAYIIDYIVVHEMCHMYHKDHSKEFWNMICGIMPDYEVRREWLRNNGIKLDL
ncbi:M48 family metallopeptidase [Clostridium botulinum]|uniref:M48 family metallopeptidase n=1 Tax=Clostridium botulinum TaxID=1491 RepID=UPI000773768C|nr:SprT family zinc-dependent metalloprotease [Clostridium botulinum]MBY6951036.1 M48 family metallopeptidase [Clostridium botulinum]MCR1140302.1 M48 family metallopeptidase [Clostridium botulinum]NEZ79938.1 M48 family peptidase [Clostridium botulinum]NFA17953.1 M48 family peptidase [Clostridium botulinum]NFA54508.1 M48 family peptidase [Clostridium botulinum]